MISSLMRFLIFEIFKAECRGVNTVDQGETIEQAIAADVMQSALAVISKTYSSPMSPQ